ncbi:MAG TPA: hypothetical protein DCR16_07205 [Lachnospiraceae bacterium]|nr:hypothetical protein [Lachnospiraceae bacterium]
MKKEQLFLARLQETVKKARGDGGSITEQALQEQFRDLSLTEAQMDQVRAYLAAAKIGVGQAPESGDVLTEEEHNYLEDYLEMIRAIPVPSDGMMDAICLSAMAGEKDAQRNLIEAMLPRVVDIARLYAGQGVLLEDLIGSGNEALTIGVTLLAPLESPREVSGFLGRRIMDAMEDLISANLDEKAVGKEIEDRVNKVADLAAELAEALMRKVTPEELAQEGEVTIEEIREAVRLSGNKIEDLDTKDMD